METKELKEILEEYFRLIFVVLKPDFNRFYIQFLINNQLVSFNYKYNNYFSKDENVISITNLIKENILNSYIK